MTIVTINSKTQWNIGRDHVSGWWVGICDALPLTASGSTYDDLLANIAGMQQTFFAYLVEEGEFDSFLTSHGWTATGMPPVRPASAKKLKFDVPWHPNMTGDGRFSRDPAHA